MSLLNQIITLGSSQVKTQKICLGTMTWGEQNTEAQAHEQLDYSLARGLTFIDTAEMYPIPVKAETYTRTEQMIGRWLAKQDRSKITLASKVAGPGRNMAWVRTPERLADGDLSKKDIMLACEASLKRLQTDYIDLYQIHWPARYTPIFGSGIYDEKQERECTSIQQQLEAMTLLQSQGKIRAFGLSNETAWGVAEFSNVAKRFDLLRPATIQNVYSLISRDFDMGIAESCRHENVTMLAYSPLAFGFLTGKYLDGARPTGARMSLFSTNWPRYSRPEIAPAVQAYADIAKNAGLTLTQLAMGFCATRAYIGSSIIGATTLAQLKETIDACDSTIGDDVLAQINAVHRRFTSPAG
jgi:aryl-alcohol dehydrogenase-like predicted oxidoreductase